MGDCDDEEMTVSIRVESGNEVENEPIQQQEEIDQRPKRMSRELKSLQSFNNPGRLEVEGENNHFCFFIPDMDEDDTPVTFDDAWHHKDLYKRNKWQEAIRLEYKQMLKNGVWRKQGLDTIPSNRKGIGTKWVFKQKKNGVFRARLVAKGYDQIAGVDFQYNFAPVTSEVTLRILLVLWIVRNYFAEVADVQTAFLHGDLDEEIFIKIPPGYKEFLEENGETVNGKFLRLEKLTYGLFKQQGRGGKNLLLS